MLKLACALFGVIAETAATAAPSIFVQGTPFWNADKTVGRVLEKRAGPVTTDSLSAFLEQEREFDQYKVCALSALTDDSYVGVDKESAADIAAYKAEAAPTFAVRSRTPDGRPVTALAVVFEECAGLLKGAAVLAYDSRTGEVLMFEEVTSADRPHWFAFLQPNDGEKSSRLFSYSSCLACGDRTEIYYHVTRRRIYSEYKGH